MKSLKAILVSLAFLAASAAQAQNTPEAIIGQCPDLPSVAHLSAPSDNQAASAAIEAFHAKISALRESAQKANERAGDAAGTAAANDAERMAQQITGRSVAELQNMSEAELEAMALRLAEQQIAAAQKPSKTASSQPPQASAEMKKITDRWQEIDRLNEKEAQEVAAKIVEIRAKYALQYPSGDIYESGTAQQIKAATEKAKSLRNAEDTECYTLWRNQVIKMQGRIKTKLADASRYDELMAQSLSAGGMTSTAKAMPSIGFSIAEQYLDAASSVTSLYNVEN